MPDKDPVEIGARALETVCWDALRENEREKLREDVRQVFAALSAAGFAVVPREATQAQGIAGGEVLLDACRGPGARLHPWRPFDVTEAADDAYRAMLAAAEREIGGADGPR